jgi:hypothetical protein
MIPKSSEFATIVQRESYPTETFRALLEKDRVSGMTDGIEALRQAIYFMLQVERFYHVIYSWQYGVEFQDLYGQPMPYVASEVKRRIKDALMIDDRITDVTNFVIETAKRVMTVTFIVKSIYGPLQAQKVVKV